MEQKNYGIDLAREQREQSPQDWKFGAASKPCWALIPEAEREQYLPQGELQFTDKEDMSDCASRAPINILEAKFTYLYHNGMKEENKRWLEQHGYVVARHYDDINHIEFSDAFVAINSGTTRQGNSLKAPLEAIRKQGLIPKQMLPLESWMSWADYHDPQRRTEALFALGREFARRFTINYEQVGNGYFAYTLETDFIDVAGFGWPRPVNGIYPRDDRPFTHAFTLFSLRADHKPSRAFDNYLDQRDSGRGYQEHIEGDFIKDLAEDFKFFDYGYRVFISKETTEEERAIQLSVFDTLKRFDLLAFFAVWWEHFTNNSTAPSAPPTVPSTIPPTPGPEAGPVRDLLAEFCLAIQSREGFFAPGEKKQYPTGTPAWRNNNPGNIKWGSLAKELGATKAVGVFAYFPSYAIGFEALKQFVRFAAQGELKSYKPDMTIAQFFDVYAPAADSNDPKSYAAEVGMKLGVDYRVYKIKQLV